MSKLFLEIPPLPKSMPKKKAEEIVDELNWRMILDKVFIDICNNHVIL